MPYSTAAAVQAGLQAAPTSKAAAAGASTKSDYSKEALVIERLATHVREEADGTGSRETVARIRIQADAGVKQMAVLQFTYTAANQQVDIGYVRVIKPDGSVVVTPDYNVQDMPADVSRDAPMYSDVHEKHVAVKGLGVGDTLEYKVMLRTLKAEVPGQFWMEYSFEKNLIVLDEELDLDLPATKTVTVASADLQPDVSTTAGRKLYHWASTNLKRPDPDKPKSTEHWKPSVQVTTFTTWADVGAWYSSLEKNQMNITPAIQAKADALTRGLTTEDEKIRAIFEAVALHIHYVGLSFGIGRYQPHPADDVLGNEYGDCKDKHTLLATLLKAAGIQAWPVLISSSRELDTNIPSPAQFDHVITVVPRDGKLIWMDSTAEVAPVGVLFATLRDKQALTIPTDRPAYLERTPRDLPFPQSMHFEADGKLSDKGQFTAHLSQSFHGDAEMLMRAAFRQVPQSQWKPFMQRVSGSMGFGGEVQEPQVTPVEKIDEPLRISYNYVREKYGEWDDHRISPAMPGIGWELMPGVRVVKPADDIDIGSPGEQDYVSKIALPAGYSLVPPQPTNISESWAEYHSTYTFKDGVFTAERRLVFKQNKVPLADWNTYLQFRYAIYADSVKMAPLFSGGGTTTESGPLPSNPFNLARMEEVIAQVQPLREATSILLNETPPSESDVAKSLDACRRTVAQIEAHSLELPADEASSLEWAQVVAAAWTAQGWLELESKDLANAESHLKAAWNLSYSQLAGYEYGRVLEARGDKLAAAHVLKLAAIASGGGMLSSLAGGLPLQDRIADEYRKITGTEMDAAPLKNGQYKGSLRAELDNEVEIHSYIRTTKVNGQGYYAVAYEPGKPATAHLLQGDKGMEMFVAGLQRTRFAVPLPSTSKARLLREVKLVCTQYAGCDAYLLLPSNIELPAKVRVLPNGAKTSTMMHVELRPN